MGQCWWRSLYRYVNTPINWYINVQIPCLATYTLTSTPAISTNSWALLGCFHWTAQSWLKLPQTRTTAHISDATLQIPWNSPKPAVGPAQPPTRKGTNFQQRRDQQTYPIIPEWSKWPMEHGICNCEITVCNRAEFPGSVDLTLFLSLNNQVFFLLGRQPEFNLYQFQE